MHMPTSLNFYKLLEHLAGRGMGLKFGASTWLWHGFEIPRITTKAALDQSTAARIHEYD